MLIHRLYAHKMDDTMILSVDFNDFYKFETKHEIKRENEKKREKLSVRGI